MFHCRFHQALEIVGHLHEPGPDFVFVLLRKVTAKVCFVASIAEVGSSLEIDRSCFVALDRCSIGFVIVDLAIAAADPFVVADPGSDSVVAVDLSVIAAGFVVADYFRSAPDLNLPFSCPSVAAAAADVFPWDVS